MTAPDRSTLIRLLGGHTPSRLACIGGSAHPSASPEVSARWLTLERTDGARIRACLTGPAGPWADRPAVLYIHAHGGKYDIGADELMAGRPALIDPPYGEALAGAGIVALCLDLPCFGSRATEPESRAAKRHLWAGTTLFGEMLDDLAGGLDLLAGWPGVDPARIGAFGLSMGATLTFWLAALDPRLRCLAHLCCFADLGELVRLDGHDRHGLYMMVPGLLPALRTGAIAGLAAPRPQFAAMGAADPLTPPTAIDIAIADTRAAYAAAGAKDAFETLVDPATGHVETPEMRAAVLRFFARCL